MIKIRNYFKSLAVILVMLFIAWFVALQLTKQRIVLEASNKQLSIEHLKSPFVWSFDNFANDVVESFQPFWSYNSVEKEIVADKGSHPQLSLNFSGQSFNTRLHDKLVIYSTNEMQGKVKIQAKADLFDTIFYFSPNVMLSGHQLKIDLNKNWTALLASGEKAQSSTWKNLPKISSLVLIFENPNNTLQINKIELPYNQNPITLKSATVNCKGLITKTQNHATNQSIMKFDLSENCLLPSNYMWLKQKLEQDYPESLLNLKSVSTWLTPSFHTVNKSYTFNPFLNALLYGSLCVFFGIIFWQTKLYSIDEAKVKQQAWYKWVAKQIVFKGAQKAISPYHLLINYAVVLIPTIIVFVVMAFIDFPNLQAFKKLPIYLVWALVQQFFIAYVLAERIFYQSTQNRLISALSASAVFSLLHLPSVTLMLATFVAGGLWSYSYLVFKRLLPLALSHALLALMFYHVVSDRVLYSAKVMQWFWE